MRTIIGVLLLAILGFSHFAKSENRIKINIPTVESETEYVWRTLKDIRFFEANNYSVSLPKGELIEDLKQKVKDNCLADSDYERLMEFMKNQVYNQADYLQGFKKIENERELINKLISMISSSERDWYYKEFDIYEINLTLYGPGGSYNPEDGSVLIFTTTDGRFKQYDNPANTIIHEIVHIGIEESLVQKYKLPHPLKERIVDQFLYQGYEEYLPGYRLQNMGDYRIDEFLMCKEDFKTLEAAIKQLMSGN